MSQNPAMLELRGHELVGGRGSGPLLWTDVGLSFWGGVDELTSTVIDHHHPLRGEAVKDAVLAIPNGRGSCTGSQVILELVLNGCAPAAIVMAQPDHIVALGVVIADEIFGKTIPVVSLGEERFAELGRSAGGGTAAGAPHVSVTGSSVVVFPSDGVNASVESVEGSFSTAEELIASSMDASLHGDAALTLSEEEHAMLDGQRGEAVRVAMHIVVRAAAMQRARRLLPISQAHIDGCTYIGPGGLRFAESLAEMGGTVAVPTTLNSISVDRRRWVELGVDPSLGVPSSALADAYVALGATSSFTCAPYLLSTQPEMGEQIAWGESNAVTFANSVLGARTQKYADYLDICAAITARVPETGCHLTQLRAATIILDAAPLIASLHADKVEYDESFWPALGYLVGLSSGAELPVVVGLEALGDESPTLDDLKAFSAAFGTSGASAMFHILGQTPEAPTLAAALQRSDVVSTRSEVRQHANENENETIKTVHLTRDVFVAAWRALDSGREKAHAPESVNGDNVQLVAVGNPHFSLEECEALAKLCDVEVEHGHAVKKGVSFIVTSGRDVFAAASAAGYIESLAAFGITFVNDTCWCMLTEPIVPSECVALITNSAKYAHYAPGLVRKEVRFSSLKGCVEAARTGQAPSEPAWLLGKKKPQQRRSFSTGATRSVLRRLLRR